MEPITVVLWLVLLSAGIAAGILIKVVSGRMSYKSNEAKAKKILEDAQRQAEEEKRKAILEARDTLHRERQEFEREMRDRRQEQQKTEKRLTVKEETIERKEDQIDKREKDISSKEKSVRDKENSVNGMAAEYNRQLERLSGMSSDEAKRLLFSNLENQVKIDSAMIVKKIEEEAKKTADKSAKNVIATAIQRCAAETTGELTVSVVPLPGDDMKGRIIGREGRNIRAFENVSGVDLIIDDTPEAVLISSFDPLRREIAKISLERLVADGRIHPARIEEIVAKVKVEMEDKLKQIGEESAYEFGLHNLHAELIKVLGRLQYRTSYGQNVLQHSKEVTHLAMTIASELGANVYIAKRASILHDLGKVAESELSGAHAIVGAQMAEKYNESKEVVHAVAAHHGEIDPLSIEAVIVSAADAISASRPGARRENLEMYLKRLENLEGIASGYQGVEKAYAIQAGREIRIIAKSDLSDNQLLTVARDIAKKIEDELDYPGQIKVVLVKETRVIEYAR